MGDVWQSIEDLPDGWQSLAVPNLVSLALLWQDQVSKLRNSASYQNFLDRMKRRIAIETGVIERLYTIDRGITQLLIEQGIDAALLPHGSTDRPRLEVIELIRDQEEAIDGLFIFVSSQRELSTSYIKELHQTLTRHQDTTEALDQFGTIGHVRLIKGDWKKNPNNPQRTNGSVHVYCPPEQVAPQMEQLVGWHLEHQEKGVPPEVEAAWLHHRFTQIHPFQDGNGRVARCLASLVFIRAGWFPLSLTRDDRQAYIHALEHADAGDLKPLVQLFGRAQEQAFIHGISLSDQVLTEQASVKAALAYAVEKLKAQTTTADRQQYRQVEAYAEKLFPMAVERVKQVEQQITKALENVEDHPQTYVTSAGAGDERASYHRYQIVETAKKLDYYANLRTYSSWVCLTINVKAIRTELLLSFHAVGNIYPHQGLFVCSACGYRKFPDADGNTSIQDLQALSQSPFHFSYYDQEHNLENRFRDWLDNVMDTGVVYWAKGL